jgi:hypothetical protein
MEMKHSYRNLAIMFVLSYLAMYILMYAMVDSFTNVYPNVNQAYMAGLMASPMIIIELLVMRDMYTNRRLNTAILAASAVAGILFFWGIRAQTAVVDEQFLRSMIPHHAGAILMCEEASLRSPDLQELCRQIVESQTEEIAQMRTKLAELDG